MGQLLVWSDSAECRNAEREDGCWGAGSLPDGHEIAMGLQGPVQLDQAWGTDRLPASGSWSSPAHTEPWMGLGPWRERGPHLQQEVGAGSPGLHVPLRQALTVPPACSPSWAQVPHRRSGFLLS